MRALSIGAIELLGFVIACGGRPLETEIERHPANVLPQGASQIFYARMDRLRDNPLAVLAYERGQASELGPSLKGANQMLQLAGGIERLALGTYGAAAGQEPATVVVATGQFDENAFRKTLESSQMPYVDGSHGTCRFFTCGRGEARCYVSFSSPRLVVASSQEDLLKRTLDLSGRGAKSMARDRGFAPLLGSFSPEMDLWVTGVFPSALSAMFDGQMAQAIELIRAFTIKLAGGDTKRLDLLLHCASAEAAQADAMLLKKLLVSVAQQMVLAGYSIPDLINIINRSEIVIVGSTADFNVEINKAELAATAAAFRAKPAPPTVETPRSQIPLGIRRIDDE